MQKISYVTCPACNREYYVEREYYVGNPDAPCHCPFCGHNFAVRDARARPPLDA